MSIHTGWLASVTTADEARQALEAGVNILDAKNPMAGALGALPMRAVLDIIAVAAGRVPVSATVGDLPAMEPMVLRAAALDMAATGVDYVKLGLFPSPSIGACIDVLGPLTSRHKLVGVVFADRFPHDAAMSAVVSRMAAAGWFGIMLDTADKRAGGLLRHRTPEQLADFVALARWHGLRCGLAGSLGLADVPLLLSLGPDLLGFRGALCNAAQRTAAIDPRRLLAVARAMQGQGAEKGAIATRGEVCALQTSIEEIGHE